MGILEKIKDLSLNDIIEFRDHGDINNAPEEIVYYLKEMEKVHGMDHRFNEFGGRDAIIKHLVKFDGYSHYLASKLHDDAMEYFYSDRAMSKDAYRHRIAEKMERAINTALVLAKDSREIIAATKELINLSKLLDLDKDDKEVFPKELLMKPVKLYTTNVEELGMPPINRYELGRFIDSLGEEGLSQAEIEKVKRDSMILPIKIFPDDNE